MSDVLKSAVIVGGTGNFGSMIDLVTLHDNHGNSTRDLTLTCAGHKPIQMTRKAFESLHDAISPFAFVAVNVNGTIPLPEGFESPLQTMCRKINANAYPPK